MPELGQNLKNIVMKGIDLIGTKAGDLASSAKQKVDTFNLENQKKDLLAEIGSKVYEMCRSGVEFPAELQEYLAKVSDIDRVLEMMQPAKETAAGTDPEAPDAGKPLYLADQMMNGDNDNPGK